MSLISILESGRKDFLDAARNIDPEHSSARPSPERWSVLECVEHVVAFEKRYLDWISDGTSILPRRDDEKELRLFTIVRSRATKLEAPEVVRPVGRFDSLIAALAHFNAVRDRSVQMVQERGDSLYSVGVRHPYFGNVNGPELVQLMDGHTRRHADQIRETYEAVRIGGMPEAIVNVRIKPTRAKKPVVFKRDPPDLPDQFESADAAEWFCESDLVTIKDIRLEDFQRTHLKIGTLRIEGSTLDRIQLPDGQFGSTIWKDVRLVGCDLANIRAHRVVLVRVELVDCRLTGFRADAIDWQDVLIRNGDVRYAQLQGGRFRACEFEDCNWQEADIQDADLSGSIFRSCDLARADLSRSNLQNTDFRRSEVEGMVVGMNDLRGAIVDPAQAMVFARVLGLQIR